MCDFHTKLRLAEQAGDRLRVKLLRGEPINEDLIGSYRPPDIPDICDATKVVTKHGCDRIVPRDWTKAELRQKASFDPQPVFSCTVRERLKYANPGPDAPLREWLRAFLDTAFAHWSQAIDHRQTKLPFAVWMRRYLLDEEWQDADPANWTGRFDERFSEAAQVLRLSVGLPRYRPGSPAALRSVKQRP